MVTECRSSGFSPVPLEQASTAKAVAGKPRETFPLTQAGGKGFPAIKKESIGELSPLPSSGSKSQGPALRCWHGILQGDG